MTKKKMVHLALRISPELDARVKTCADELRLKKHTLAQAAVEAAVDAIEQNGYSLVFPIKFEVTRVAVEKTGIRSSSPSPQPKPNEVPETPAAAVPPAKRKRAA